MDKNLLNEYKDIIKKIEQLENNKKKMDEARNLYLKVEGLNNRLKEARKYKQEIEEQLKKYNEEMTSLKSDMNLEENPDKRKELFEKYRMIQKEKEYIETYNIEDIKEMVKGEAQRISRSSEYNEVDNDFKRYSKIRRDIIAEMNELNKRLLKEFNKEYQEHPHSKTPFIITGLRMNND